jgi:hypothetical protein
MQSISLAISGQISEPIEVGPGARVTATGSGYVQWAAGTLADARNGVVTWATWPRGTSAGVADTLRRVLIRGVATGALTIDVQEGFSDPGDDNSYWQQEVQWIADADGSQVGLRGLDGGVGLWTPPAWATQDGLSHWDHFLRPDGPIGVAPSGQLYTQVTETASFGSSRTLGVISGNRFVAPDSGSSVTAAYTAIDLGKFVARMRARISWLPGTVGDGAAVLIVTNTIRVNDINHIIADGSIHLSFKDNETTIGFFVDNAITYIAGLAHPTMLKDGTQYDIGFDLIHNTCRVFVGSSQVTRTDNRFLTYAGRFATYEHFWSAGGAQPVFHRIGAG